MCLALGGYVSKNTAAVLWKNRGDLMSAQNVLYTSTASKVRELLCLRQNQVAARLAVGGKNRLCLLEIESLWGIFCYTSHHSNQKGSVDECGTRTLHSKEAL